MAIGDLVNRLRAAVDAASKSVMLRLPTVLQGFVGREFGSRNKGEAGTPNKTEFLRVIGGRLFRSFSPKSPDSIAALIKQGFSWLLRWGTKVEYAGVHEYGGDIAQRIPVTAKMRAFFWARFKETQDPKWKAFALAKRQEINRIVKMRERPFMRPALTAFKREGMPLMEKLYREEIRKAFNGR